MLSGELQLATTIGTVLPWRRIFSTSLQKSLSSFWSKHSASLSSADSSSSLNALSRNFNVKGALPWFFLFQIMPKWHKWKGFANGILFQIWRFDPQKLLWSEILWNCRVPTGAPMGHRMVHFTKYKVIADLYLDTKKLNYYAAILCYSMCVALRKQIKHFYLWTTICWLNFEFEILLFSNHYSYLLRNKLPY